MYVNQLEETLKLNLSQFELTTKKLSNENYLARWKKCMRFRNQNNVKHNVLHWKETENYNSFSELV